MFACHLFVNDLESEPAQRRNSHLLIPGTLLTALASFVILYGVPLWFMCYSIYAWHGIVMNEMIPPEPSHLADTFRVLAPYLFITLALSALSYRYIEFGRERNWRAVFLIPVRAKAAVWSQL